MPSAIWRTPITAPTIPSTEPMRGTFRMKSAPSIARRSSSRMKLVTPMILFGPNERKRNVKAFPTSNVMACSALPTSIASPAEQARGQWHFCRQHRLARGFAERDTVRAFRDPPLAGRAVEAGEQSRIGRDRDDARSTGRELHPLEAEQAHALLGRCTRQIELRHVGAFARAGVLHGKGR